MDKFVTRAPTWKTKSTVISIGKMNKEKITQKPTALSEKQKLSGNRQNNRDVNLVHLFQSTPSSSTRNFCFGDLSHIPSIDLENTPPSHLHVTNKLNKNKASDVSDYVNIEQSQNNIRISQASPTSIPFLSNKVQFDDLEKQPSAQVPEATTTPKGTSQKPTLLNTPKSNGGIMSRINRDLNSPSASVRLRALKALQNPENNTNTYSHFDVPHEEQPIITEDERKPTELPSIKDVMRDVVVYAEVRTGEDNRTAGIKKVIASLGARVNDRLLRDTTHVVFKDGLLSTYKKAKQWNIPIVSILWVEECKKHCKLCDPKDFPISDIERYEYPELYEKMKRHKSMQPDSECNKRIRIRNGTPKEGVSTPKSSKKTSTNNATADTPTTSGNKKTEISQYFNTIPKNQEMENFIEESPVTKLTKMINKIHEATGIKRRGQTNNKTSSTTDENKTVDQHLPVHMKVQDVNITTINDAPDSSNVEVKLDNPLKAIKRTPRISSQRRKTVGGQNGGTPISTASNTNNKELFSHIDGHTKGEVLVIDCNKSSNDQPDKIKTMLAINELKQTRSSSISSSNRRTTFGSIPMDVTSTTSEDKTLRRSARRRTVYTPRKIENCTLVEEDAEKAQETEQKIIDETKTNETPTQDRYLSFTCVASESTPQPLDILLEEKETTKIIFSSTRKPGSRRTLFDLKTDLMNHNLQTINKSARLSASVRGVTSDPELYHQYDGGDNCNPSRTQSTPIINNLNLRKGLFIEPNNNTPQENGNVNTVTEMTRTSTARKRKLYAPDSTEIQSTEQTQTVNANSIDGEKSEKSKVTESSGDIGDTAKQIKKRKLYVPEWNEWQTTSPSLTNGPTTSVTSVTRRRTVSSLASPSQSDLRKSVRETPSKTTIGSLTPKISLTKRATPSFKPTKHRESIQVVKEIGEAPLKKDDAAKVADNKKSKNSVKDEMRTNWPFLVYTNMHTSQVNVIRETVERLGGFNIESDVSDHTTHIISLEPRRTLNLLRGLIRGLWVLDYQWLLDSKDANRWLPEEPYELRDFSRAIEICRAEKQAFGIHYKCELFTGMGPFYISQRCGPICRGDLVELIQLCGGKVVDTRKRAKYILGSATRSIEDKIYVTPFWILDSITQMQLMRMNSYLPQPLPPSHPMQPRINNKIMHHPPIPHIEIVQ